MIANYAIDHGHGKKTATKDGGPKYLRHDEIAAAISRMVFDGVQLRFTMAAPDDPRSLRINGWVYLEMKVQERQYHRRHHDEPNPVRSDDFTLSSYTEYSRQEKALVPLGGSYEIMRPITLEGLCRIVLNAIAMINLHEIQEKFYFEGERPFDPHIVGEILGNNLKVIDLTGYQ